MIDWPLLLAALVAVESGGNVRAHGDRGTAHGPLQIRQGCLTDVNRARGTRLQLEDMHNPTAARWVCVQYLILWDARTYEQAARRWNGGPQGDRKRATLEYWRKVEKELNRLKQERNNGKRN